MKETTEVASHSSFATFMAGRALLTVQVLWAIVSASEASLPFGYLEYALQRLDQYYHLKDQILDQEEAAAARSCANDDYDAIASTGEKESH